MAFNLVQIDATIDTARILIKRLEEARAAVIRDIVNTQRLGPPDDKWRLLDERGQLTEFGRRYTTTTGTKEVGAARRSSMDMTRQLARLRSQDR